MKRLLIRLSLLLFASPAFAKAPLPAVKPDDSSIAKATEQLQAISLMRENLAASIDATKPITKQTFAATCQPVGKALKRLAKQEGYELKQVSEKFRNPQHKPTADDVLALQRFDANPNETTIKETLKDGSTRLYVRINVVSACLHCHGPKGDRPQFIKTAYPEDKAFDFKPGELRGAYVVTIVSQGQKLP